MLSSRWLQVLAERYTTFRLEVQTANDKGERTTYSDLARRVMRREDRTAAAAMPQPRKRPKVDNPSAGAVRDCCVTFCLVGYGYRQWAYK